MCVYPAHLDAVNLCKCSRNGCVWVGMFRRELLHFHSFTFLKLTVEKHLDWFHECTNKMETHRRALALSLSLALLLSLSQGSDRQLVGLVQNTRYKLHTRGVCVYGCVPVCAHLLYQWSIYLSRNASVIVLFCSRLVDSSSHIIYCPDLQLRPSSLRTPHINARLLLQVVMGSW